MKDAYNLDRFLSAQGENIDPILSELTLGSKHGHWMWYIFPQIKGLGFSAISQKYAISSKEEAIDYLNHPILGRRLTECTTAVLSHTDRSAETIFGYPDYLKFCSSMTLFNEISEDLQLFQQALNQFYLGRSDSRTLELLSYL